MTTKRKDKVKTKAKFKVGQVVKVTWIDSGCSYSRMSTWPEDCELSVNTTYGKVVHVNKERIVIASHQDKVHNSPRNDMYEVIWRPSIQSWRVLK